MPKRKMIDELEEIKNIEITESELIEPKYENKLNIKKKPYKVVLITKNKVVYESSPGNGAATINIWGDKLVPGDTIYLEE